MPGVIHAKAACCLRMIHLYLLLITKDCVWMRILVAAWLILSEFSPKQKLSTLLSCGEDSLEGGRPKTSLLWSFVRGDGTQRKGTIMMVKNWLTSTASHQTQRPRFRIQDNETLVKIWSEVSPVQLSAGIENLAGSRLELTDKCLALSFSPLAC